MSDVAFVKAVSKLCFYKTEQLTMELLFSRPLVFSTRRLVKDVIILLNPADSRHLKKPTGKKAKMKTKESNCL